MTSPKPGASFVVASYAKSYVSEKSQMNTSDAIFPVLTTKVKLVLDRAMELAKKDGRKTVLDRDVERAFGELGATAP